MYMTRIRNDSQSENLTRDIYIYSSIEHDGLFGMSAKKLLDQLQGTEELSDIILHINSEGGDVFEGIAIYNFLKNTKANITVEVDGLCASAASIIAMAGEKIIMKTGSMMLIHNPITFAAGDSDELKNAAEILDKVKNCVIDIYQERTGLSRETINDLMNKESYMSGDTCKELGFADEVIAPAKVVENKITSPAINSLPVKNKIQDEHSRIVELIAGFYNVKASRS